MCWIYTQNSGCMEDENGRVLAMGYSGAGEGKNNPTEETVQNVGPIPEGFYDIQEPFDSAKLGPYVMALLPDAGTHMFNRSDFYIHGDSKDSPGNASHGCIVLPHFARMHIWESGDHRLQVIKEMSISA